MNKKSILIKEIKKEIIIFANTHGGKIYIGIDDNLQSLTGMINESIKSSSLEHTQIKTEKYDNKDVIIIDIQRGSNKPYYLTNKGLKISGVYLMHGSS